MKPTVLVLTSTYPRWPNDTDPGFVHDLCVRLLDEYDVHVLAPHCAGTAREETFSSVQVHRYRYWFERGEQLAYDGGMLSKIRARPGLLLILPFFFLGQCGALLRMVRRYDVRVIHAHWVIPQGVVAWLMRPLLRRVPLLVTCHGADVYGMRGNLMKWLRRRVFAVASEVTVVSRAMADELSTLVPGSRLSIAPMGVNLTERFVPQVPELGRAEFSIIFVGRLVEKKGVDVLIEAVARLLPARPAVRLTLVGDGPLRPQLEAQAAALGIAEAVQFTGAMPNSDVPALLNRHSVAVVPSVIAAGGDQEGLGLVTIEAMGCGCAVVASDLPAIRDVVRDGINGLLFETGSADALAHRLDTLFSDRDLRETLALRGRADVLQRFDWQRASDRYRDIYARLLKGADSPATPD